MRACACFVNLFVLGAWLICGCGEKPIGQPCPFGFPTTADGTLVDCAALPICHPLQERPGAQVLNDACPIDCIQMPSLDCENLICVATQIEGDNAHMNGRCAADVPRNDCPASPYGCSGYCTKECLTDASCPPGYQCSAMAPFGQTLSCANEIEWGTNCTANCVDAGQVSEGATCPSTNPITDQSYTDCAKAAYSKCCACICYQFCPILAKKFCRKETWDNKMFSTSTTGSPSCGGE